MKKFIQEFKEFALQGNVLGLAVGVIIGAAFQGVVASLTENILSPIIGLFARQNLDSLALDIGGATLGYGAFLTSVINFLIMAFVVFVLTRAINKMLSPAKKEEEPIPDRFCPYCKTKVHLEATKCPSCTSQIEAE
ncbi:MAG: large conductance mechanosensitive channel protein MscL [Eubacteriaceae bacterium]|jgi:large conductance mechanosensitive channel|nr:large conductance mechanosensitive channel protein MscL [Eubacteriaceae bacterium]